MFFWGNSFSSDETIYRYNESALKKLQKGEFQSAINDLKAAHSLDPYNKKVTENLAVVYNNYGFYLLNKGQIDQALEKFERAINYEQNNPYMYYNLAKAYYEIQNMEKAKLNLEKAYKLNPEIKGLKSFLAKVTRETSLEREFDILETMHFIVSYSLGVEVHNMSYIRTYLEEAYGRLGMFLDYYPKNKIIALIYSEEEYKAILKNQPYWTMAFYDGKVRIPAHKFSYSERDVVKIIYHEYAHSVTQSLAKGKCPSWLSEGISCRVEEFVEAKDKSLVKDYIEGLGFVPLRYLFTDFSKISDIKQVRLLYLESLTVVEYILSKVGSGGLRNILVALGDGMPINVVFEKIIGEDLFSFEQGWKNFLRSNYSINNID